jgi:3-hydroxybutyryl-CoA dehydratase
MNRFGWTDLSIGMSESFQVSITESDMTSFAQLSGDFNPLHVDAAFAKRAGFASCVVFGMLTSAYYSRLVGMMLPGKYAVLHGIDIDFKSPVFVGDELLVSGQIKTLSQAYRQMELSAKIVRQGDKKIVSKCVVRVGLNEH